MWRRVIGSLVCLAFFVISANADDKAKAPAQAARAGSFEALKQEYMGAQKKFADERLAASRAEQKELEKALADAKTDEEKAAARKKFGIRAINMLDGPGKDFSPRFLEFAKQNPKDPAAFESIAMALQTSGGAQSKIGTWQPTVQLLQAEYVTKPEIKKVVRMLAQANDDATTNLLREVMAKNPDKKIQGFTCKQMIEGCKRSVQAAEQYKANPELRERVEEQLGKEQVEALIARADTRKKETEDLEQLYKDRYASLFPDLSIGKPAPEVVTKDVDGKPATLSALKGKVVVLDVWATWCGPCRAMIPHEREMVEKLRDKPFALVSISADDELKTLTDFLAKEKMPWTHWWVGSKGGFVEDWDIQYFPTIYILDSKGVIRHKDLRGERMEKAVGELLAEMELKSE